MTRVGRRGQSAQGPAGVQGTSGGGRGTGPVRASVLLEKQFPRRKHHLGNHTPLFPNSETRASPLTPLFPSSHHPSQSIISAPHLFSTRRLSHVPSYPGLISFHENEVRAFQQMEQWEAEASRARFTVSVGTISPTQERRTCGHVSPYDTGSGL